MQIFFPPLRRIFSSLTIGCLLAATISSMATAQERPGRPGQPPQKPPQRPTVQPSRPPAQQRPQVRPAHPQQPVRPPATQRPPGNTRPPGGDHRPPGGNRPPGNILPGGNRPGGNHPPIANRPPGGNRPPGNRPPINHRPPGWSAHRPAYTRPPHTWGGRHFYTYHRYYSHPYRPYAFGPSWHPLGFFLNAIATTATIVAINNIDYRYDEGVFYEPSNNGYQVVAPPLGAIVSSLPPGNVPVQVDDDVTYYYYGGTFYLPDPNGYLIVKAPPGAIVYNLPDGCTQVQAGDITYLQYNGDYYQPIQFNGQPAYEVVELED